MKKYWFVVVALLLLLVVGLWLPKGNAKKEFMKAVEKTQKITSWNQTVETNMEWTENDTLEKTVMKVKQELSIDNVHHTKKAKTVYHSFDTDSMLYTYEKDNVRYETTLTDANDWQIKTDRLVVDDVFGILAKAKKVKKISKEDDLTEYQVTLSKDDSHDIIRSQYNLTFKKDGIFKVFVNKDSYIVKMEIDLTNHAKAMNDGQTTLNNESYVVSFSDFNNVTVEVPQTIIDHATNS